MTERTFFLRRLLFLQLLFLSAVDFSASSSYNVLALPPLHRKYVGKVKQAVFYTQKTGRKRVVISTEENVLASLDVRRGDIFWRHVLGPNDAIEAFDIALGKYAITLSSGGSTLRAWNLPDGQMIWESFLKGLMYSQSLVLVQVLDLYVWLSYRMEDSFPDREVALSQKALCSMLIEEFLRRYGGLLQRPKATKLQSRKGLYKLL